MRINQSLADSLQLSRPSEAETLVALLGLLDARPAGTPDTWLTTSTPDEITPTVTRLAADLAEITARQDDATRDAGVPWREVPALRPVDLTRQNGHKPASTALDSLTSDQVDALANRFAADADMLDTRTHSLSVLAALLGLPAPTTFGQASDLLAVAHIAAAADRPERAWLTRTGCDAANAAGHALYGALSAVTAAGQAATACYTRAALHADVHALARQFADEHIGIKKLSGAYRADKKSVRAFTRPGVKASMAVKNVPLAVAWKQAVITLAHTEAQHAAVLGAYYAGRGTDFNRLQGAMTLAANALQQSHGADRCWAATHLPRGGASRRSPPPSGRRSDDARRARRRIRSNLRRPVPRERTDSAVVKAALTWATNLRCFLTGTDTLYTEAQVKAFNAAIPQLHLGDAVTAWANAKAEVLAAFDTGRLGELHGELDDYTDAADLLAVLSADSSGQDEWLSFQSSRAALGVHGLGVAVDFCIAERSPAALIPKVIERALLQEWADHQLKTDRALRPVRAEDRDSLVTEYQQLDRSLVGFAAGEIIRACNSRRPRNDVGQAAVIRREASKKRKHMPVRVLLERSRNVTQAIKPCFMMSPLAVSQFLPAGMRFDVVIFDEASQVPPADAINCIYRGRALITAGDQKQLPPTSFFATGGVGDSDEWSEEESEGAKDFESILDLAKGSGAYKSLTLRWHYRSRHEALIAFSNVSFYDGRLITFPGAEDAGANVGVELIHVDGTYRRASARDNPVEAAKVAERVIHHYDTRPHLTLGVVAFSLAQATAIESAIDHARLARPDLDRFFIEDRLGGFFVKNLESVQGDERDVMIFSIGYGPDENRKFTMNFGPLNRPGGWRRLNVAITRARYRNEIVASINAGDITASATSEGIRHMRRYLDYAERGIAALALETSTGGDAESPFEESVIQVIRSWGYQLTPQVGTAAYRIDIGVRHPVHPGVYVLAVECDGYQYHSSMVARDRDRLREQVLRGLGWHLHRIWGTAWYRDRQGAEDRLRAAIELAVAAPIHGLIGGADVNDTIDRPDITTVTATFNSQPEWTVPYTIAAVEPLAHWTDPSDMGSRFEMAPALKKIAEN